MNEDAEQSETSIELPQNIIRVETALSRFPIHRLGTKTNVGINIHEKGQNGEVKVKWAVKHQPGPLAYKLDTLIVNRRIEEAARPVPKLIRLGSLREICRELGVSQGKGTQNIKEAIYQNAEAFITAKTKFRLKDGGEQTIEAGFSRYSVIFTGEQLPDGRRSDAVYIVLNDIYMQVINGAMTRPLDYDYLKDLPPSAQRFYEILSYQIFAALKNDRPTAKLVYSEFCTYAPQTRYLDFDRVKKQMYKVHFPHKESGYIKSVHYTPTTDAQGQPDWVMLYIPGNKARAEFRAFTKRGGPMTLQVEAPSEQFVIPILSELEQELAMRGVSEKTARELGESFSEERIRRQIEYTDWLKTKGKKKIADRGGFLAQAIREDYKPPEDFIPESVRAEQKRAKLAKAKEAVDASRRIHAEHERSKAIHAKITEYFDGLSTDEQKAFDAEALREAHPEEREKYLEDKMKKGYFAETIGNGRFRDEAVGSSESDIPTYPLLTSRPTQKHRLWGNHSCVAGCHERPTGQ